MTNIAYAKLLRKRSTPMEIKLWQQLRDRRFMGLKFRRQYTLGPYIVDFICIEKSIIIEVDGGQHAQQQEYDAIRTEFLNKQNYRVLRFWNHDVLNQFDVVIEHIYSVLFDPPSSGCRHLLPPAGEGDPFAIF